MLQGIILFKDFETIFAFLLNSLTDHYLSQFLVRLIVFLSDDKLIFVLLFETDDFSILGFETSKTYQCFKFSFFSASQPQFSHVCLSFW